MLRRAILGLIGRVRGCKRMTDIRNVGSSRLTWEISVLDSASRRGSSESVLCQCFQDLVGALEFFIPALLYYY